MSGALSGTNMARLLSASLIAGARDGAHPGARPTRPRQPVAATQKPGPQRHEVIQNVRTV